MAGNQYQDGKNVFIMKCQAGNNSDGQDTRGLILLQTKKPNHFSPKQAQQQSPAAASKHLVGRAHLATAVAPGPASCLALQKLRFCYKVSLQVSTSLQYMFKSSVSAQPAGLQAAAGPNDVPVGRAILPKTPPAAAHSSYCNQSPKVG